MHTYTDAPIHPYTYTRTHPYKFIHPCTSILPDTHTRARARLPYTLTHGFRDVRQRVKKPPVHEHKQDRVKYNHVPVLVYTCVVVCLYACACTRARTHTHTHTRTTHTTHTCTRIQYIYISVSAHRNLALTIAGRMFLTCCWE